MLFDSRMVQVCGSVHSAIMLCCVMDRKGWFKMTQLDWKNATGLSRFEQESSRELLRQKGFLTEELRGIPASLYFLVHYDKINEAIRLPSNNGRHRKDQFVYLMKNRRNGLVKIGISTNPSRRERTLQSEEPDIDLLFSSPSSIRVEKSLHELFSKKRVRGEWFKLNDDDVLCCINYITENSNNK